MNFDNMIMAEQGFFAELIHDNTRYDAISDLVRPWHFYHPDHANLYEVICAEIEAGRGAKFFSLQDKVKIEKDILLSYAEVGLSIGNISDYAQQIVSNWKKRQISSLLQHTKETLLRHEPNDTIEAIERGLTALTADENKDEITAIQAADKAIKYIDDIKSGRIKPIKTGFENIDNIIGGLYGSRFYIIAGRPAMGKTSIALNIADNISQNTPVLFLSLEMADSELAMRLIAARTGISIDKQQSGKIDMIQSRQIVEARATLVDRDMVIYDGGAKASMTNIRTWARRFKRKRGNFVLFIDHLGLMAMDKEIRNKVHQIEEITTSLKTLAKELDIPIVLLCQLSRAVESRDDKRPNLSDLRDSGSIEQDADAVMLCYRAEYYLRKPFFKAGEGGDKKIKAEAAYYEELNDCAGKAEIIVAKNRQGKTNTARLNFDGERQQFVDD